MTEQQHEKREAAINQARSDAWGVFNQNRTTNVDNAWEMGFDAGFGAASIDRRKVVRDIRELVSKYGDSYEEAVNIVAERYEEEGE